MIINTFFLSCVCSFVLISENDFKGKVFSLKQGIKVNPNIKILFSDGSAIQNWSDFLQTDKMNEGNFKFNFSIATTFKSPYG